MSPTSGDYLKLADTLGHSKASYETKHARVGDLETVSDLGGFAAANDLVGKSDVEVHEASSVGAHVGQLNENAEDGPEPAQFWEGPALFLDAAHWPLAAIDSVILQVLLNRICCPA
jgi:hypothetical protein